MRVVHVCSAALVATAFGTIVHAQVPLTELGTPVTESFDGLANTGTTNIALPPGWAFVETEANANTFYRAGSGSENTGDTYSAGAADSTERAFGGLRSGSLITTLGAQFENTTGGTIESLAVEYTGEIWRVGTINRLDRLDFQYSLNATGLATGDWVDVDALDFDTQLCVDAGNCATTGAKVGNNATHRAVRSGTIEGLDIAAGQTVWIRWTDFQATGADDTLAIDDFSLTPDGTDSNLPFVLRRSLAVAGSYAVVGNVLLDCSLSPCPLGNNGTPFVLVDADDDDTTAGSSAATLDIPDDATPRAAYLLVTVNGSGLSGPGPDWVSGLTTANVRAKFKAPGEDDYTTLTPFRVSRDGSGTAYQGLYDVTAQVSGDGQYWVADPTIYPDTATYNGVGNWILIVVYDQPNAPLRLVNIYDGVQACFQSSFAVPLSGFETPSVGPVSGTLTTVGGDGAASASGDSVTLNALQVQNAINPSNNIGNNTVSGVDGQPFPRTPSTFNATDELVDIDTFDITSAFPNNATSGTVTFACGGDGVVWHGLVLAFDVDAPELSVQKSVTPASEVPEPGGELTYVIDVTNLAASPENARLVAVTDVLPAGVTISGPTFTLEGGAAPATLTVAADGDAGEVVDGVLTVDIGDLPIGETRTITFRVRIADDFGGTISNEARATYRGVSSSAPIIASSNVASVDVASEVGDALALVFFDEDGNDAADFGEVGLEGWQLTVGDTTVTTDFDGLAELLGLPEGEQPFTIVPSDPPDPEATWVFQAEPTVFITAGEPTIIEVAVTCTCDDQDPCTDDSCTLGSCEFQPVEGECGGAALVTVTFDDDGDGEPGVDETGLPGWIINIGQASETTDDIGFAVFGALPPGTLPFSVIAPPPEDPQAAWVFTAPTTIAIFDDELTLEQIVVDCVCDDQDPCTEDFCFAGLCSFEAIGANEEPDDTCNGADENCDGRFDEGFVPTQETCGLGVCQSSGTTTCLQGVPGTTCVIGPTTGDDTDCDTVDDDCDGTPDDGFAATTTCGVGVCQNTGAITCVSGVQVPTCIEDAPTGTDQDCDGEDDDCDGTPDDGFGARAASCGVGVCQADNGIETCVLGTIASTCVAGLPSGTDQDCDGDDDDCDGVPDDGFVSGPTTCGVGECGGVGHSECIAGAVQNVGCVVATAGTICTSAGPCAEEATCQAGVCTATRILSCADDNPCTTDSCDPQLGCVFRTVEDGTACDDESLCTGSSTCTDGICAGDPLDCAAPDLCEGFGECNPATGVCDYPAIPGCDPCPAVDITAPIITCPAPVTVECADADGTEATLGAASARDECGAVTVTSDAPGVFGPGNTTVTFTARDADGNTATCTTTVSITDTTAPVVFCPEETEVEGDPGTCGALVTHVPSATDACGAVEVLGPPADTFYPAGPSDATYIAVDAAGNRTTCATVIDVTGLEGLDITCEAELTVAAPADFCGWPEALDATVVDLCRSTADVSSDSDFFPIGQSTVTFTASRDALSDTCATVLTVNDVTPPAVSCGVPPVDAEPLDLLAVFTSRADDACGATLTISELRCAVGGTTNDVRCQVSSEGGTVTVDDAPEANGQRVEIVWTVTAVDPSGNSSGAIECRVGVDPASLDHDFDGFDDRDDNCPAAFNDQLDQDDDGVGDACDDEVFTGLEALGGGGCAGGGEVPMLLAVAALALLTWRRKAA